MFQTAKQFVQGELRNMKVLSLPHMVVCVTMGISIRHCPDAGTIPRWKQQGNSANLQNKTSAHENAEQHCYMMRLPRNLTFPKSENQKDRTRSPCGYGAPNLTDVSRKSCGATDLRVTSELHSS